jgi:hypothetical protein
MHVFKVAACRGELARLGGLGFPTGRKAAPSTSTRQGCGVMSRGDAAEAMQVRSIGPASSSSDCRLE